VNRSGAIELLELLSVLLGRNLALLWLHMGLYVYLRLRHLRLRLRVRVLTPMLGTGTRWSLGWWLWLRVRPRRLRLRMGSRCHLRRLYGSDGSALLRLELLDPSLCFFQLPLHLFVLG
jgi:hypothetical protein